MDLSWIVKSFSNTDTLFTFIQVVLGIRVIIVNEHYSEHCLLTYKIGIWVVKMKESFKISLKVLVITPKLFGFMET